MTFNDLKKLGKLLIFTKDTLRLFETRENALSGNISYWQKKGELIILKKGMYTLKMTIDKEVDKTSVLEFFANKMYEPSYLTGEYVMQKYGLLTEGVFGITSATAKKTKNFNNSLGAFSYYSLTTLLFTGFFARKFKDVMILEASKEKAVFDFLYLRFLKKTDINEKSVEELRINWENLKNSEFAKMKKWVVISKRKRIMKLFELIKKQYYA